MPSATCRTRPRRTLWQNKVGGFIRLHPNHTWKEGICLTALLIVLIVLAVLALIGLVPLGIDHSFGNREIQGTSLKVILGPATVTVLPKKEKKEEKEKKEKKKRESASSTAKAKDRKEITRKARHLLYESRKELRQTLLIVLREVGRFHSKLTVNFLLIHIVSGDPDPCEAVMKYGRINAALGVLEPLADQRLKIRKRDIGTAVDFGEDHTTYDFRIKVTIPVWKLILVEFRMGFPLVRQAIRIQTRARTEKENPEDKTENESSDTINAKDGKE